MGAIYNTSVYQSEVQTAWLTSFSTIMSDHHKKQAAAYKMATKTNMNTLLAVWTMVFTTPLTSLTHVHRTYSPCQELVLINQSTMMKGMTLLAHVAVTRRSPIQLLTRLAAVA